MRLFPCFQRAQVGPPPVTVASMRQTTNWFRNLENQGAGLGPFYSPDQIRWLVLDVQRSSRAMEARAQLKPEEQQALAELESAYIAYRCRTGDVGAPLTQNEGIAFEEQMRQLRHTPLLSDADRRTIATVCQNYPDFVRRLMLSSTEREAFFKWALRSGCSLDVIAQFPSVTRKLMDYHAEFRLGGDGIRVNEIGFVEMKVFGDYANAAGRADGTHYVSVHDDTVRVALPSRVNRFAPPLILTVGGILAELDLKNDDYGTVEALYDGLSNWKSIRVGSVNPQTGRVDRWNSRDWIHLPPKRVVTLDEIRTLFPNQNVAEDQMKFALCSTRKYRPTPFGPQALKTHAFIYVYVPNPNGTFNELCMGLQPYDLPKSDLDFFLATGSTRPADVHTVDASGFASDREFFGSIYDLTPEMIDHLGRHLTHELDKGATGRKTFSPQGNNCANWAQKAFWKTFIEPLLFDSLRTVAQRHHNGNLPSYLRSLERATKARNETAQKKYAERFTQHLNQDQLIDMMRRSHNLLSVTFYKDHPDELRPLDIDALRRMPLDRLRPVATTSLIATLHTTQIYPVHIVDLDTGFGLLNIIIRIARLLLDTHLVSHAAIAGFFQVINFVFFASWRFSSTFKSLFTNKYAQAGTQAHPSGIWMWHERRGDLEKRVTAAFRAIA